MLPLARTGTGRAAIEKSGTATTDAENAVARAAPIRARDKSFRIAVMAFPPSCFRRRAECVADVYFALSCIARPYCSAPLQDDADTPIRSGGVFQGYIRDTVSHVSIVSAGRLGPADALSNRRPL